MVKITSVSLSSRIKYDKVIDYGVLVPLVGIVAGKGVILSSWLAIFKIGASSYVEVIGVVSI